MTQTTDGPDTEIEKAAIIHETRTDRANTSGWIKVAFAGSLTMAVWSLALQALAGFIPPVAVIGIIFATFAVFLRGDRPPSRTRRRSPRRGSRFGKHPDHSR